MPIYEYKCGDCGAEFEKLVNGRVAIDCPSCRSGRVIRQLSLVGIRASEGSGGAPAAMSGGGCCGGGCGCH